MSIAEMLAADIRLDDAIDALVVAALDLREAEAKPGCDWLAGVDAAFDRREAALIQLVETYRAADESSWWST